MFTSDSKPAQIDTVWQSHLRSLFLLFLRPDLRSPSPTFVTATAFLCDDWWTNPSLLMSYAESKSEKITEKHGEGVNDGCDCGETHSKWNGRCGHSDKCRGDGSKTVAEEKRRGMERANGGRESISAVIRRHKSRFYIKLRRWKMLLMPGEYVLNLRSDDRLTRLTSLNVFQHMFWLTSFNVFEDVFIQFPCLIRCTWIDFWEYQVFNQ
jgi:hypothetical protein